MRRFVIAGLRFGLGLALVGLLLWWLLPGPAERQALVERVHLHTHLLGLGLVASAVASIVTSARWRKISEDITGGPRLPFVVYFHSLVLSRVLGQVSSTLVMDLVGRGLALRRAGSAQGISHVAAQAALERVLDFLLPVLMLGWAAAVWRGALSVTAAWVSFVAVCAGFAVVAVPLFGPLARLAVLVHARLLGRWLRWRQPDTAPPPPAAPPHVPTALAAQIVALSLGRYLAVLVQFWAAAAAVGVVLEARQIAAATPVGQLASMAGFTPGGLGISELGWAGGLTWVGVDAPAVGLFVLTHRLVITASFAIFAAATWPAFRRVTPGPSSA